MSMANTNGPDRTTGETRAAGRGRRRTGRVIAIVAGAVVVVLVVLVALAPTIASSMAPGRIEGALNPTIQGRVEVEKASIGWFSPLKAGPVEVYDPAGERVARVEIDAPVTVWQVVSNAWWSAERIDVGTVTLAGDASIKQYNDGTTNLQRAFEPTAESAAKPKEPSAPSDRPLPAVKAGVEITNFDATVRKEADGFKDEMGVKGLKGVANVDADVSGGTIKATADLSGNALAGSAGGGAGAPMTLKVDADIQRKAGAEWSAAGLERAKVKVNVDRAPVAVVDALGQFGGALVEGVGREAGLAVDVQGGGDALAADVSLTAEGASAEAHLAMRDGRLTTAADKPATAMRVRSTEFLSELPQTRSAVADASRQIWLEESPSIEVVLEKLDIPISGGKNGASGLAGLDFRGAKAGVRVKVSGVSGQVALPRTGEGEAAAGADWKPFAVSPIELAVDVDDFAKPVQISTGTKATLDGKDAGNLSVSVNAEGLLDAQGRLRALQWPEAGMADRARARVALEGVATALLQPVLGGTGLPLELSRDVGPQIDLIASAEADVDQLPKGGGDAAATGLAAAPPTGLTLEVRSANITANAAMRLERSVLTTTGPGVKVTVESAAPLAGRILAAGQGEGAPAVSVDGRGRVELVARDLRLNLGEKDVAKQIAAAAGTLGLSVSDARVTPNLGGRSDPVRIDTLGLTAELKAGAAPKVEIASGMAHPAGTFAIDGQFVLEGLRDGTIPEEKGIGLVTAVNPIGSLSVKNLPRDLLWVVEALNKKFGPEVTDDGRDAMGRAIATAVRESIGQTLTLTLRTQAAAAEAGGGQYENLKLETAGGGVGADIWTHLNREQLAVTNATVFVAAKPETLNPVLAAMGKTETAGGTGTSAPPMRLGAPSKVHVSIDKSSPVVIPLKTGEDGARTLDLSRAGTAKAKISIEGDVLVENIAVATQGEGDQARPKLATLALSQTSGEVTAPLGAALGGGAGSERAAVKVSAIALDRTSGAVQLAKIAVDASATPKGERPQANVALSEVNTAQLEQTLGKPDLVVGALGDSANLTLTVKPMAGEGAASAGTQVEAELTSPLVSGASVSLASNDERIWITEPSTITWRPNAAFINKYLLGGQPEAAAPGRGSGNGARSQAAPPMQLQEAQPISVRIERLVLAQGKTNEAGGAVQGPLKPGVFDLAASVTAPSLGVRLPASEPGSPAQAMTIEGVTINARALEPASGADGGPAGGGRRGPRIEATLNVAKVTGAGAASEESSSAKVTLVNIADENGTVRMDGAVVHADADFKAFPTPIVDQLANQGGLLNELLGPTVTLKATARNVTLTQPAGAEPSEATPSEGTESAAPQLSRGMIDATATSVRATAKLKGRIRAGRFVQNGPFEIEIRRITPTLVQELSGGLPLVDSLEKTAEDQPATVVAEKLTVPLDNDMTKLNGKVTVDPGVARFTTRSSLGGFIKNLGGKQSGAIGRKMEPFVVNINKGVLQYDRFRLPFGEFALETSGQVDLVQRRMKVTTYAPFFALSDEALGRLKVGLPGNFNLLDRMTMVPITVSGPLDNPKTELDLELLVKEIGKNLINAPGEILSQPGKILDDLLNKDKPKEAPK